MSQPGPARDPAKARFIAIQAMRFMGVALVIFGLLVINRQVDLPIEAGYALFLVGLVDALVMPTVLSRRWKTPPQ